MAGLLTHDYCLFAPSHTITVAYMLKKQSFTVAGPRWISTSFPFKLALQTTSTILYLFHFSSTLIIH